MTSRQPGQLQDAKDRSVSPPGTQTLIRGLRIVEAIAAQDQPIGVGELSRQLGLPKSTVQRLLRTLEREEWVETSNEPITRWQLSSRLRSLSHRSYPSESLRNFAFQHLVELWRKTGEAIYLSVPTDDTQLVLIERIDSIHTVRAVNPIGATSGLHTSASGKSWLAMLPDDEIEILLAQPLARSTENTIVDPQILLHQICETRARGYAVNISEYRAHVCAIAAAVPGPSGRPVATVAVCLPDIRFVPAQVPEWGKWVQQAAQSISQELVK